MNLYRVHAETVDRGVWVLVWAQSANVAVMVVARSLGLDCSRMNYQAPEGDLRELWQYSSDLGEAFAFLLVTFTCVPAPVLNAEVVDV